VAPHPGHKIQSIFIKNGHLRPALCKGNIRSGRLWTFVSDDRPDLPAMFVDSRDRGGAYP
jgi:hypothetical protein